MLPSKRNWRRKKGGARPPSVGEPGLQGVPGGGGCPSGEDAGRLDGILAYGRLLIDAGRPAEARPYLEDVIASDPSSPMAGEARILLGET